MNADTVKHTDMMLIIAELRRKFNQKLDDQLFIIEQQRDRIDYQQQQINDQRVIIEELAWQIRDLRDSVRKCNENIRSTNIERSENKINTILVSIDPNETKSKHVEGKKINLFFSFFSFALSVLFRGMVSLNQHC